MTNSNTYDDNTNPDLPGEIHDEFYDQTFPCGFYQDRWWDWNDHVFGPNADEPCNNDGDFDDDHEDDSWNDGESLASAGWGTDEDYGLFDDGGW